MEDRVLHRRQEQAWGDLHDFVEKRFMYPPARAVGFSEGMLMSRVRGDRKPSAGLPHPQSLIDHATHWTSTLDAWHLVAFSSICSQAKSFFVAHALLERDSPLEDIAKATEASRVEEEFQISNWGLVVRYYTRLFAYICACFFCNLGSQIILFLPSTFFSGGRS